MEKEKLKEPYLDARLEITQIPHSDVITTSADPAEDGWNNSTSNGWT